MARGLGLFWLSGGIAFGLGFGALALIVTAEQYPSLAAADIVGTDGPELVDLTGDRQPWPALFGTAPPPETTDEDPRAVPTATYILKGLVAGGTSGWAILSGGDGDRMVAVNDTLDDGSLVVAITPDGVEIETDEGRRIVGFSADQTDIVAGPVPPAVPLVAQSSTLSLKELREGDFRRMLALAGGVKVIDLGDGALAQQIIWVRNGRLYDRIGLREGDTILTINGIPAGDTDSIMAAVPDLLTKREFELVVSRAGARMTLEVLIDEDV